MKTLGLCFVLAAALISLSAAQSLEPRPPKRPNHNGVNLDQEAMKKLLEQNGKSLAQSPGSKSGPAYLYWYPDLKSAQIDWFHSISPTGEPEPDCGTMRTYRVKREAPDSDLVQPSSYTTCVPLLKFRIQWGVPKLDSDPEE